MQMAGAAGAGHTVVDQIKSAQSAAARLENPSARISRIPS
jgi:hypothetical protein